MYDFIAHSLYMGLQFLNAGGSIDLEIDTGFRKQQLEIGMIQEVYYEIQC